jgi:UDP-glucose 4-epimerase
MGDIQTKNFLIVGGLGFVGARLASALSQTSSVVVTSRSLSEERKRWLDKHANQIKWISFDSSKQEHLPSEDKVDCIINLAMPSAAEASKDYKKSLDLALTTVRSCLELARNQRTRLIHFSTFHVYGSHGQSVFTEENNLEPTHPYGQIHLRCEQELWEFIDELPIFIVRPTNIVGFPSHADLGVQSSLIFLDLCRQCIENGEIRLRSNGLAYRDFVPMKDAINAVELISAQPVNTLIQVLNLSSGIAMRLDDLAQQIQKEAEAIAKRNVPITLGDGVDSFNIPFNVSNERLQSIGWKPKKILREEIKQTLKFFSGDSEL